MDAGAYERLVLVWGCGRMSNPQGALPGRICCRGGIWKFPGLGITGGKKGLVSFREKGRSPCRGVLFGFAYCGK